jgi:hypothetical protein
MKILADFQRKTPQVFAKSRLAAKYFWARSRRSKHFAAKRFPAKCIETIAL